MEHEEILRRIREEREDHDESQRDIAAALNMTQSQYQKYEAGKTVLSLRCLIGICNHYKVSADYLLGLPKNYRKPRRL
ncbi:MAG: helix-turn-helix transcriptional regulator [Oscillospiraceae bacterium]|nr:helix-turn-helix transcriptional regulator [Oscillospiraceae bacterium]